MMLTLDRFAKKKPPVINVLNKTARYKITVVFRTKTSLRLTRPIGRGGGGKVVVYKTGWVGEGMVLHLYHKYK